MDGDVRLPEIRGEEGYMAFQNVISMRATDHSHSIWKARWVGVDAHAGVMPIMFLSVPCR